MTIKKYAGIVTAVMTGSFVFDLLWVATKMMVQDVLFLSMISSVAVGLLFCYLTDEKEKEETSRFVTMENGLNVLIQKSKKKSPDAWQSSQGK